MKCHLKCDKSFGLTVSANLGTHTSRLDAYEASLYILGLAERLMRTRNPMRYFQTNEPQNIISSKT